MSALVGATSDIAASAAAGARYWHSTRKVVRGHDGAGWFDMSARRVYVSKVLPTVATTVQELGTINLVDLAAVVEVDLFVTGTQHARHYVLPLTSDSLVPNTYVMVRPERSAVFGTPLSSVMPLEITRSGASTTSFILRIRGAPGMGAGANVVLRVRSMSNDAWTWTDSAAAPAVIAAVVGWATESPIAIGTGGSPTVIDGPLKLLSTLALGDAAATAVYPYQTNALHAPTGDEYSMQLTSYSTASGMGLALVIVKNGAEVARMQIGPGAAPIVTYNVGGVWYAVPLVEVASGTTPSSTHGMIPYAMAANSATLPSSAANTPTSTTITLPTGRFTAGPAISIGANTTVIGTTVAGVAFSGASATSFTAWVTRANTSSTGVHWIAVQMTPTAGGG